MKEQALRQLNLFTELTNEDEIFEIMIRRERINFPNCVIKEMGVLNAKDNYEQFIELLEKKIEKITYKVSDLFILDISQILYYFVLLDDITLELNKMYYFLEYYTGKTSKKQINHINKLINSLKKMFELVMNSFISFLKDFDIFRDFIFWNFQNGSLAIYYFLITIIRFGAISTDFKEQKNVENLRDALYISHAIATVCDIYENYESNAKIFYIKTNTNHYRIAFLIHKDKMDEQIKIRPKIIDENGKIAIKDNPTFYDLPSMKYFKLDRFSIDKTIKFTKKELKRIFKPKSMLDVSLKFHDRLDYILKEIDLYYQKCLNFCLNSNEILQFLESFKVLFSISKSITNTFFDNKLFDKLEKDLKEKYNEKIINELIFDKSYVNQNLKRVISHNIKFNGLRTSYYMFEELFKRPIIKINNIYFILHPILRRSMIYKLIDWAANDDNVKKIRGFYFEVLCYLEIKENSSLKVFKLISYNQDEEWWEKQNLELREWWKNIQIKKIKTSDFQKGVEFDIIVINEYEKKIFYLQCKAIYDYAHKWRAQLLKYSKLRERILQRLLNLEFEKKKITWLENQYPSYIIIPIVISEVYEGLNNISQFKLLPYEEIFSFFNIERKDYISL